MSIKRLFAIYLPLFALLTLWYVELTAVILSVLIYGNVFKMLEKVNKRWVIYIFLFTLAEIALMLFLNYNIRKCIEQILLISVTCFFYCAYFVQVLKCDIALFVKCYLNMITVLVCYALIAFAMRITISGRLEGWGGEPGDIALLVLPALVYYFYYREISLRSILASLAFILAESLASFTALVVIVIMIFILISRKNVFFICAFSLFFFVGISKAGKLSEENQEEDGIALKFNQTWKVFQNEKIDLWELETMNASTYAFLTNFYVAVNSPSRLLGTGLGTHPASYEIIYPPNRTTYRLYGLNSNDAYSLLLRLYSEAGGFGLMFLLFFLYRNFNSKCLYSFMALDYIINACITGGHYTANGSMLFFVFYYFAGHYGIQSDLKDRKK